MYIHIYIYIYVHMYADSAADSLRWPSNDEGQSPPGEAGRVRESARARAHERERESERERPLQLCRLRASCKASRRSSRTALSSPPR